MTLPARDLPERRWERYVAIGDSFTEGLVDEHPDDGTYVGWADRLAMQLAHRNAEHGLDFGYANLAVRGRLIADVVGPQLDAALALSPDLVSIVGGGNDCMRPHVDLDDVRDQLEDAVARIRATGADVLMCTTTDPGWAPLMKVLRPRLAAHTANVWGIAQRQGARVVDMWSLRSIRDGRMWGADRIHLSTAGHERVAAQAAWTLGLPVDGEDWTARLDPLPSPGRWETAQAHAQWVATHLTPWVQRRVRGRSSGDVVSAKRPEITPLDPRTP